MTAQPPQKSRLQLIAERLMRIHADEIATAPEHFGYMVTPEYEPLADFGEVASKPDFVLRDQQGWQSIVVLKDKS